MQIKVNYLNKSGVVRLDNDAKFEQFLAGTRELNLDTSLEQLLATNNAIFEYDYPKRKVDDILSNFEASLKDLGFKNGQQVWIVEKGQFRSKPAVAETSSQSSQPNLSSSASSKVAQLNDKSGGKNKSKSSIAPDPVHTSVGTMEFRQMKDDNSCLFHSVSFCLFGDANHEVELRHVVADAVLADPIKYTEAFLGKSPQKYVEWILTTSAWGGAIELDIFSHHFQVEINSVDVKSGRVDKFQCDAENPRLMVVFYSGIHYDAMVCSRGHMGLLGTVDHQHEKEILDAAQTMRQQLLKEGYVTDMASIKVICNQCFAIFSGEKDVAKHMQSSGHNDFEEVQ